MPTHSPLPLRLLHADFRGLVACSLFVIIALLLLLTIALGRYMFFFQLPWLPEFTLRSNDFRALDDMMKSEKMGIRTEYTTSDDMEAYKHNFARKSCLQCAISNKFFKMALLMVGYECVQVLDTDTLRNTHTHTPVHSLSLCFCLPPSHSFSFSVLAVHLCLKACSIDIPFSLPALIFYLSQWLSKDFFMKVFCTIAMFFQTTSFQAFSFQNIEPEDLYVWRGNKVNGG